MSPLTGRSHQPPYSQATSILLLGEWRHWDHESCHPPITLNGSFYNEGGEFNRAVPALKNMPNFHKQLPLSACLLSLCLRCICQELPKSLSSGNPVSVCICLWATFIPPQVQSVCKPLPFQQLGRQLSNETRFVSLLPTEMSSLEISSFSMESPSAHCYQSTGDGRALSKISPAWCPAPLLSSFYHRILHLLWL